MNGISAFFLLVFGWKPNLQVIPVPYNSGTGGKGGRGRCCNLKLLSEIICGGKNPQADKPLSKRVGESLSLRADPGAGKLFQLGKGQYDEETP